MRDVRQSSEKLDRDVCGFWSLMNLWVLWSLWYLSSQQVIHRQLLLFWLNRESSVFRSLFQAINTSVLAFRIWSFFKVLSSQWQFPSFLWKLGYPPPSLPFPQDYDKFITYPYRYWSETITTKFVMHFVICVTLSCNQRQYR